MVYIVVPFAKVSVIEHQLFYSEQYSIPNCCQRLLNGKRKLKGSQTWSISTGLSKSVPSKICMKCFEEVSTIWVNRWRQLSLVSVDLRRFFFKPAGVIGLLVF